MAQNQGTRGSNASINNRPKPVYDKAGNDRPQIPNDPALEPSFGEPVEGVQGFVAGHFSNFGRLAGWPYSATYEKDPIHIEDSIKEQLRNLPGSRSHR